MIRLFPPASEPYIGQEDSTDAFVVVDRPIELFGDGQVQMVDFFDVSKDLRAFHLGQDGPVAAIVLLHLHLEDLDGEE